MDSLHTVRVNSEWLMKQVEESGGAMSLATKLGVTPSTISRQLNKKAEAGPRFIGAVLTHLAVSFQDAFDVTEERQEKPQRFKQNRSAA